MLLLMEGFVSMEFGPAIFRSLPDAFTGDYRQRYSSDMTDKRRKHDKSFILPNAGNCCRPSGDSVVAFR
jgi:hypothetical protein